MASHKVDEKAKNRQGVYADETAIKIDELLESLVPDPEELGSRNLFLVFIVSIIEHTAQPVLVRWDSVPPNHSVPPKLRVIHDFGCQNYRQDHRYWRREGADYHR